MRCEIAAHDAKREREFGREHGYEVYPSTDEPELSASLESVSSHESPRGRDTRAPSPAATTGGISRSDILRELGITIFPARTRRTRRELDTNWMPGETDSDDDSSTGTRAPSPGRLQPLNSWSHNPIDAFFSLLCNRPSRPVSWAFDRGPRFPQVVPGSESEDMIFSLLDEVPEYSPTAVDGLRFDEAVGRMQDALLRRIMGAAVREMGWM
jgi:hypothetical protein